MTFRPRHPVGEMRPSQLLRTYGVGAITNLPRMSTLIMGLDYWDLKNSEEISEPRLLQAIQSIIGVQVKSFRTPSVSDTVGGKPSYIGVPVAAFPRWMVCSVCHLLSSVDDGIFTLKPNHYHPDRTAYHHESCQKAKNPVALPSRFLVACERGHLDDFPWHEFVMHKVAGCRGFLYMNERGVSGEPSEIFIKCGGCGQDTSMSRVFSTNEERNFQPECTGRSPHLNTYTKKKCTHRARVTLLSASNTWFPLTYTALSIPEAEDELGQLIEEYWNYFEEASNASEVQAYLKMKQLKECFSGYDAGTVWDKIQQQHATKAEVTRPQELKLPEWEVFINPARAPHTDDFEITMGEIPSGYEQYIEQVVLVERLREVVALTGFTRIESLSDYAEDKELPTDHIMGLTKYAPTWLPAAEVRGEGIFLQFREDALQEWLQRLAVKRHNSAFQDAHRRWRVSRKMADPESNYPGVRYVLLHTFAHALMRQLSLECGYSAASIRERIYAQPASAEGGAMAGILLYTAASDSEGTLGGLVSLGKDLGYHMYGALEDMQCCASDPLCAEHVSLDDTTLHGAACHACMFIPETSCEKGNRYLDRSLLIQTMERDNLAFFQKR